MNRLADLHRTNRFHRPWWHVTIAWLLTMGLAGCFGSGDDSPPADTALTVGAAGGVVPGPDGFAVSLPAGALAAETRIDVRRDGTGAPALPGLARSLGAIYTITPHIARLGQAATLSVPFDAGQLDAAAAPPVVLVAEPGGKWEALPTGAVQDGKLSASTVHFSYVTVAQWPVRYVSAQWELPDSVLRPTSGQTVPDFLVRDAATVALHLRLDRSAFETVPTGVMCGTPMTIVVELWLYDAGGWRQVKSTSFGPYTAAATADYGIAFDYTYNVDALVMGTYRVELVEACDLVYNVPGFPPVEGGLLKRGPVGQFSVLVQPPVDVPIFGHQPQAVLAAVGDSALFEAAGMAPPDAQISWWRSNDGGATWVDTGVTGVAFRLVGVAATDDGARFRARLCGYGQCIDSWPATLTVTGPPLPPVAMLTPTLQSVLAGQTATFVASTPSTPLPTLAIYRQHGGTPEQVLDCGVTNRCSYTSPPLTVADDGTFYFAQVVARGHQAGDAGFSSISALARVDVSPPPQAPAITQSPADASVQAGAGVSFSVQASGTAPLAYQWQYEGSALADRAASGTLSGIAGAASATLTLSQVQAADAGHYGVVVSNGIAPAATSAAALLTVTAPPQAPAILTQPAAVAALPGGTARFGVVASGTAPLAYQWSFNGVPLHDGPAGGGRAAVSGSGSDQLVLTGVQAADAGAYRVLVSNGTPPSASSADAALVVLGTVPLAAGYIHTCALRRDASLACWGANTWGQLGDGTRTDRATPTSIAAPGRIAALAAGTRHSCALMNDGSLACWGDNTYGQLGDGTTTARLTPVAVPGLRDVTALAVGLKHSCVLRADTSVACWGDNANGQLGDGSTTSRPIPGAVPSLTGVLALAAGGGRTCAIKADHGVVCWGWNAAGELGDGSTMQRNSPGPVPGLSGVVGLATGQQVTCAWRADGSAACWGLNGNGQLGDGTLTDRSSPVAVAGLTGAQALAVGDYHVCALMADGSVGCWGSNGVGQLGNGSADQRHSTAIPGLAGVTALRAGSAHTCAQKTDGALLCWGWNAGGQIGDGSTVDRRVPTAAGL
jgi:alpha-tubulin suppressor-like RCC1 family protein